MAELATVAPGILAEGAKALFFQAPKVKLAAAGKNVFTESVRESC